jgi:XTP/dITP diphosphohydrolase
MQFILATRNPHKVAEVSAILGDTASCLSLADFPGAPEVVEDAPTFAGNAAKKALALAGWLAAQGAVGGASAVGGAYVLADDSGLEVDALGGAPGVHSARFAALDAGGAGNSADAANNAKLLRLLADVPPERRTARFRCVLALTEVPPHSALSTPHLFDGVCEGRLGFAPKGANGFGYDPLFLPNGLALSFAELGEATKNQLSHRARALAQLRRHFGQRT